MNSTLNTAVREQLDPEEPSCGVYVRPQGKLLNQRPASVRPATSRAGSTQFCLALTEEDWPFASYGEQE
jgi:hypothetical protein